MEAVGDGELESGHGMKKIAHHKKRFSKRFGNSQRLAIFVSLLLIAALASIYAFSLLRRGHGGPNNATTQKSASDPAKLASTEAVPPSHQVIPENTSLPGKTEFGQFPPYTEAERGLEKMLRGKDEDIDLALANWLIVADIPQFADLTREAYFAQLDAMTGQVRQDMARMQNNAKLRGKNLNSPDTRCGIFCNAIIKLKFAYCEEFAQHDLTLLQYKALYSDANNVFLAGLNRTRRGSCVSMPLIYMVIGQRLGFPVHLVHVGKHFFVRWQEPGYRLNIETTGRGQGLGDR